MVKVRISVRVTVGLWVRVGIVVGPQVGLGQGNGIVENKHSSSTHNVHINVVVNCIQVVNSKCKEV